MSEGVEDRPGTGAPAVTSVGAERTSPGPGPAGLPATEREARRRVIAIELTVAGFFLVVLLGVFAIGVLGIGPYGHGHL